MRRGYPTAQQVRMGPGDGRRIVSRPARMRQPIRGPGRPRELVSAGRWPQAGVDLAGDVTLEAADDFLLRQAFFSAPVGVGAGRGVGAQPGDHDPVEGVVGLAVAAGAGAVTGDFPRRCGDRGNRAQVRPGGLGAEPLGVVPGGDEQQRRGVRADAVKGKQARGVAGHEGDDELVEAAELAAGKLGAPAELAQRDPGGVADDITRAGTQRGGLGDERGHGVLGEPGPQVRWPGQDQGPGLAVRLGPLGAGGPPGGPSARGPPPLCRRGPWARRGPGRTARPGRR
jgi:hypothetical protein